MIAEKEMTVQEAKRKRIDGIWWAGMFIWAGLVFLAQELDVLPQIGSEGEWWIWIFLGAGAWALLLNIFRVASPDWPNPKAWDYIWTVIFLGIGLGGVTDFNVDVDGDVIAAVFLVGIGVVLLTRVLRRD